MKVKRQSFTLYLLLLVSFALGYFLKSALSYKADKADNLSSLETNSKENDLSNYFQSIAESRKGRLLGTEPDIFRSKKMHITSPLFEGKEILTTKYYFRGDEIQEKNIVLDDNTILYLAEFHPLQTQVDESDNSLPVNFATFSGYENNDLTPNFVGAREIAWEDLAFIVHSSSQDSKYYVELSRTQDIIDGVAASTIIRTFPNVKGETFLTLLSLKRSLRVNDSNDPKLKQALTSLQKIAESIEFGEPGN